jgi:hypothetical protein
MAKKKFSPKLHEKYDQVAKDRLVEIMMRWEKYRAHKVDPYGQYDVDIMFLTTDGKILLIDVEVRPGWKTGEFPFSSIHLPYRKKKFAELSSPTKDVYFCAFRADLNAMVMFQVDEDTDTCIMSNRLVKNEKFFDVPIEKTTCFTNLPHSRGLQSRLN